MYADWFADLERLGGPALAKDMLDGAEAYLQMWERADGVRSGCAPAGRTRIKLGAGWPALLRAAGQPLRRDATWNWCVTGRSGVDVALLGADGRVTLAGSTARGRSAGGLRVGARMRGSGVRTRGRAAYVVRNGRVVAVATTKLRGKALKAAMAKVRAARATRSVYRASASSAAFAGKPLAATGNPAMDAKLALLCRLLSGA